MKTSGNPPSLPDPTPDPKQPPKVPPYRGPNPWLLISLILCLAFWLVLILLIVRFI